ncbi:hypothetical protein GALL_317940 [mine drainage metagenome]|uniref:DUF3108 domain-containing protein n=1 Tax=mine drainage metagenome TaxID=410659 RepID=A0A1J5QRU2_9ZZZZ
MAIHAALLWLPLQHFPHELALLPTLGVRLEPRPPPVAKLAAKPETENQVGRAGGSHAARPKASAAHFLQEMKRSDTDHALPKHVQLAFAVYRGSDVVSSGEIRHRLDIDSGSYRLQSTREVAGLTGLPGQVRIEQTSAGRIGEHGLQPESFREEKTGTAGKQEQGAVFDRVAQRLHFLHGGDAALPVEAQDALSFMYQLSQLPLDGEIIPLSIGDGTRLVPLQLEIGAAEDIDTPMGKLRALHLRSMHEDGEAYFELWLGLEYRLLPVKFRQLDGSGNVVEEFAVSDLRGTDE